MANVKFCCYTVIAFIILYKAEVSVIDVGFNSAKLVNYYVEYNNSYYVAYRLISVSYMMHIDSYSTILLIYVILITCYEKKDSTDQTHNCVGDGYPSHKMIEPDA